MSFFRGIHIDIVIQVVDTSMSLCGPAFQKAEEIQNGKRRLTSTRQDFLLQGSRISVHFNHELHHHVLTYKFSKRKKTRAKKNDSKCSGLNSMHFFGPSSVDHAIFLLKRPKNQQKNKIARVKPSLFQLKHIPHAL